MSCLFNYYMEITRSKVILATLGVVIASSYIAKHQIKKSHLPKKSTTKDYQVRPNERKIHTNTGIDTTNSKESKNDQPDTYHIPANLHNGSKNSTNYEIDPEIEQLINNILDKHDNDDMEYLTSFTDHGIDLSKDFEDFTVACLYEGKSASAKIWTETMAKYTKADFSCNPPVWNCKENNTTYLYLGCF